MLQLFHVLLVACLEDLLLVLNDLPNGQLLFELVLLLYEVCLLGATRVLVLVEQHFNVLFILGEPVFDEGCGCVGRCAILGYLSSVQVVGEPERRRLLLVSWGPVSLKLLAQVLLSLLEDVLSPLVDLLLAIGVRGRLLGFLLLRRYELELLL